MKDFDAQKFLEFHVRKDIAYLYKRFLTELEDLKNQHAFMLTKLIQELPPEYHPLLRASNFFDDNEFAFRRKKVLDAGNDAQRAILEQINKFSVELPKE